MKLLVPLFLAAAAAVPPAPDAGNGANPAGLNFTLPVFTPQGHRYLLLRGSRGEPAGPNRYEVTDMNLTLFVGDASNRVDTVILAPRASFQTASNVATGTGGLRLIRDDLELSGERWTYDHARQTVLLENNVEVTIHAALPSILQ
jgi:hypothetical protein